MSDEETIGVYDAKANEYAKCVEQSEPDPTLLAFLAKVKEGGRILDLGCGVANASAVMRDEGFQVDAVDASASMVALANKTHDIGAVQQRFDALKADGIYDGVWANFSLLHTSKADFPGHLSQVKTALKPDGIFHIGMKLGEGEIRDSIGRFYSYYSFEELSGYLEAAGFTVLDHALGEGMGLSGEVSPWATILSKR